GASTFLQVPSAGGKKPSGTKGKEERGKSVISTTLNPLLNLHNTPRKRTGGAGVETNDDRKGSTETTQHRKRSSTGKGNEGAASNENKGGAAGISPRAHSMPEKATGSESNVDDKSDTSPRKARKGFALPHSLSPFDISSSIVFL